MIGQHQPQTRITTPFSRLPAVNPRRKAAAETRGRIPPELMQKKRNEIPQSEPTTTNGPPVTPNRSVITGTHPHERIGGGQDPDPGLALEARGPVPRTQEQRDAEVTGVPAQTGPTITTWIEGLTGVLRAGTDGALVHEMTGPGTAQTLRRTAGRQGQGPLTQAARPLTQVHTRTPSPRLIPDRRNPPKQWTPPVPPALTEGRILQGQRRRLSDLQTRTPSPGPLHIATHRTREAAVFTSLKQTRGTLPVVTSPLVTRRAAPQTRTPTTGKPHWWWKSTLLTVPQSGITEPLRSRLE